MRDIVLMSVVLAATLTAFRHPWIGVMLWTWISIMNPHRYTYGFAYDMPIAAMAAGSTLLGLLFTRDRQLPLYSASSVLLVLLMIWITISWRMGLDPRADYAQWDKVMKIDLMILVALALVYTKLHIITLAWVAAGSIGLLAVKGGLFTLATGGSYRVWGPPASFIADNNHFALAVVVAIPLLRFLQTQLEPGWRRHGMTVAILLCGASALGSHSRGALVAISAMLLFLWIRSRQRLAGGTFIIVAAIGLVSFMPDAWVERMTTISGSYQDDRSANLRVSAWWNAFGIAKDYPFGVGFNQDRPELFALYSPYPDLTTGPHSIYFQMLGNHGFVGLGLFLAIFVGTYFAAGRLRKEARGIPEAQWCDSLGAMCQVALIGYFVGGAFLALSYFDLPYNIMVLVVAARYWVRRQAWKTEPAYAPRWYLPPGVISPRHAH